MHEQAAKRIIEAIQMKISPPANVISFAVFLARNLSPVELEWLESLGHKEANRWLVSVLLDTKKYKKSGDWVSLRP